MKPKPWDRKMWGVMRLPSNRNDHRNDLCMLLGSAWSNRWYKIRSLGMGEPTRVLLFNTRRECRAWINDQRKDGKFGSNHFRCVRVRELVEVCDD